MWYIGQHIQYNTGRFKEYSNLSEKSKQFKVPESSANLKKLDEALYLLGFDDRSAWYHVVKNNSIEKAKDFERDKLKVTRTPHNGDQECDAFFRARDTEDGIKALSKAIKILGYKYQYVWYYAMRDIAFREAEKMKDLKEMVSKK